MSTNWWELPGQALPAPASPALTPANRFRLNRYRADGGPGVDDQAADATAGSGATAGGTSWLDSALPGGWYGAKAAGQDATPDDGNLFQSSPGPKAGCYVPKFGPK